MPERAEETERAEHHGEQALSQLRPIPAKLPRQVLRVVEHLLDDQHQRAPWIVLARWIHGIGEDRGLRKLLARDDRPEIRPGPSIALIHVRIELRPDWDEQVDAEANHGDDEGGRPEARPQQGPSV